MNILLRIIQVILLFFAYIMSIGILETKFTTGDTLVLLIVPIIACAITYAIERYTSYKMQKSHKFIYILITIIIIIQVCVTIGGLYNSAHPIH